MAKKPNVPCARCGKLLWTGATSLPAGQRVCHSCRRSAHDTSAGVQVCRRCMRTCPTEAFTASAQGKSGAWCKQCHAEYARARSQRIAVEKQALLKCTDCGAPTSRGANASGRFCEACALVRRRAADSRKVSLRRVALRITDITPEFERNLRRDAVFCLLCHVELTDDPSRPNSKQLDHIVPIVMGGTHTMDNVRIICRTCNLTRPRDGSDLKGHRAVTGALSRPGMQAHAL